MPPLNIYFLAWFCFVPLFLAVFGTRFIIGFIAGLIAVAVPATMFSFSLMPVPYPSPGEPNWVFGGFMLFGIVVSILSGVVAETKNLTLWKTLAYGALAVVLEACLLPILPVHLALSQWQSQTALKLASVTGIWGVSFLLWFSSLLLLLAIKNMRVRWSAVVFFLVIGSVSLVMPRLFPPMEVAPIARVAIVQTMSNDLDILSILNRKAGALPADIVVWPELSGASAAPGGDTSKLIALSKQANQPPFVTSFEDALPNRPHNTAALFASGLESARYFKRRPFGGEVSVHTPGTKAVLARWEVPIGLNVCFDSCDPTIMRETGQLPGIGLIALPTQDPVAPGSVIQALHASYTPFRAAELGVAIARSDMTAYSMVAGPDGEILAELPPGGSIAAANVPPPHETIYRRFGDWFLYMCMGASLALIASTITNATRKKGSSTPNPD